MIYSHVGLNFWLLHPASSCRNYAIKKHNAVQCNTRTNPQMASKSSFKKNQATEDIKVYSNKYKFQTYKP